MLATTAEARPTTHNCRRAGGRLGPISDGCRQMRSSGEGGVAVRLRFVIRLDELHHDPPYVPSPTGGLRPPGRIAVWASTPRTAGTTGWASPPTPCPSARRPTFVERADCGATVVFTGVGAGPLRRPARRSVAGVRGLRRGGHPPAGGHRRRSAGPVAVDRAPGPAAPHGRAPAWARRRWWSAASAPHRAEAFDAARFCIDTLKATAPIWKRETWDGGEDWSNCAHPVEEVPSA